MANLQYGDDELVLYTGGDMCGLTVARTDKPIIQLGTGWPTTTHDGASDLPDGPYQRVSSNATSGPASWAVLRCARDWMSVELQPGQQARLSRAIGPASTVTPTGGANRLVAVISPNQQIRQRVLTKLAS